MSSLEVFLFLHHRFLIYLPKLFPKLNPKEQFLYVHHLNNPHQLYFFILEWKILVLNIRIKNLLFFYFFNRECVIFYVNDYHHVHDRDYDHVCVHVNDRVYDHFCADDVHFQNYHFYDHGYHDYDHDRDYDRDHDYDHDPHGHVKLMP